MLFFELLLTLFAWNQPLIFDEVEIYRPIFRDAVAVAPSGSVFLLDRKEAAIYQFDEQGKLKQEFGGKGSGPGEFSMPNRIFFSAGKLYVYDMRNRAMSVFDGEGKYLSRHKMDGGSHLVAKVSNGWVFKKMVRRREVDTHFRLGHVDDHFENPREIFTVPLHELDSGKAMQKAFSSSKGKVFPIFGARYDTQMEVSPDGKYIFISSPAPLKIYVIDGQTLKLARVIERDEPQLPFDEEFGKEMLESYSSRKSRLNYKSMFPEYFPVIRFMRCSIEGHLLVSLWDNKSKSRTKRLILNEKGEEVELPYKTRHASLILHREGDDVWVSRWDREEEIAEIVKCKIGQLDALYAKNKK